MAESGAPSYCSSGMEELNNGGGDGELNVIAVSNPSLKDVCDRNEIETIQVLHLAWGLVVGIYTGASDVSFGCIRRETAANESPVKEWLHRMAIDRSTPIIEHLKQGPNGDTHQIDGLEDASLQNLALGRCDTVLLLDVGLGGAAEVLGRRDLVHVSTVKFVARQHRADVGFTYVYSGQHRVGGQWIDHEPRLPSRKTRYPAGKKHGSCHGSNFVYPGGATLDTNP